MVIERMGRVLALACALLAPLPAWSALQIQHWQLANGARVYFVEARGLPMLDVSVDFPAGSGRDAAGKAGVASLTRHMLFQGAAGMSDDQISRRFADIGAAPGGSFDRDRGGVGVRTLSSAREREQALATLAAVLQRPDFPEAVLEREKARVLAGIREAATQPASIADKAFWAALYGDHPYGLPPPGDEASVAAIGRADLVEFHRRHYTAANAVVALIGDLSRAEADAVARQLTDALPAGEKLAPLPPVALPDAARIEAIDHPAQQSHIFLGYPGVKRGDADYFPLFVGNYILGGGGFASRLLHEVREKRGYAYSTYSYFAPMQQAGPFQIGLQTKREQTAPALEVVRATLAEFIAKGPTVAELNKAKSNLVLGFPLRIDSNRKILDHLAVIGFYGLPLDYLDTFTRKVEAVSAADIRAAFARRIDPARMLTVVVGGAEAVK